MNLSSLSASSARATATETQPLSLKEGQMIHGKITQLFPGQMAQVQVGNHQLYAKLEVPMQAGDNYYFKVNGTEPELQLQVISGPMRGGEGQSAQLTQLMESLNLPKTQEMKDILATIIKQKIPMTKENMLEAVNLLKSVPAEMKANALATLGKIAEARLPFTPAVFQSLLQTQTGTIAQQLTTLLAAIQSEPNLPPAMRQELLTTMQALSSPLNQTVGKELLNQSLAQLLDPQAGKTDRFAALQLLKNADILPARTSLANLPQVLAELVTKASMQSPNSASAMANQMETGKTIQSLMNQLSQTPISNQQTVKTLVQNITQQLTTTVLPEPVKNALQTVINQLTQQPMTDSSKAAVVEQFNKVFTQANTSATTPPAAINNVVQQVTNATATVQTVQAAIGQLSQIPAADHQAVKAIVQNLTQQLHTSPVMPESMKTALQNVLNQFAQQPMTDSSKAAVVEQFNKVFTQANTSTTTPLAAINNVVQQVTNAPAIVQTVQAAIGQLSQIPAADHQAVKAIVQNLTQQLHTSPVMPESMKTTLQNVLNQFAQQPMTDSSKAAVLEQFNKVFTQANTSATTPLAATNNVAQQATNAPATVQTVQAAIGQLSQAPAADHQAVKAIVQNLTQQLHSNPVMPESMKTALQNVLNQFAQQPMTEGAKTVLVEQLSQTVVQQASKQETTAVPLQQQAAIKEVQQSIPSLMVPTEKVDEAIRALMQSAEKSENAQVKQMIQAAEVRVSQTMNGPIMKEALQHVLSTLGMNYEAVLGGKEPDLANLASTLKPQLLAMLQDPTLSPPLRDAAETMVLRMNGTVLQSGDTGLQQQLIMQVPLEMFGKKIDATLQWNGRMKENGKIDPAFARILFYLELESLSTTLVDMHVQNKVVNLTIFNELSSLKTIGSNFQSLLKEGLEGAGYKLSGVTFKPFNEQQQIAQKPTSPFHLDEGGVDYRI